MVFADKLMQNGYRLATRAGISICSDDMLVPTQKSEIISAAEKEVKEIEGQYTNGLVTNGGATTRLSISGVAPGIRSPRS